MVLDTLVDSGVLFPVDDDEEGQRRWIMPTRLQPEIPEDVGPSWEAACGEAGSRQLCATFEFWGGFVPPE